MYEPECDWDIGMLGIPLRRGGVATKSVDGAIGEHPILEKFTRGSQEDNLNCKHKLKASLILTPCTMGRTCVVLDATRCSRVNLTLKSSQVDLT